MTILNTVTKGSGGGANIGEPLNLTVTTSRTDATITWTDNEIGTIPPTSFAKSELVRKVGSAPTSPSDGTLVVTETVKDTYKTTGYVDSGLTGGTTYYYRVFSYSDLGGISYCDAVNVTIRLPAEYQEVEWIGGTNRSATQEQVYIDTGITTSNNIGAWTEMLHTATRNDVEWFTNTLPNTTVRRGLTTYPSGNWCPQWETWRQTDIEYNINQFYDIKLNWNNNKKCDIDGTTIYNCTNTTFSSNNTIRIGNISYDGYGWKCKFFKISDGTTLVRDFIPCYRKSDNVIGLYDLVNKQFYTNAGTGTFSKGPDVN